MSISDSSPIVDEMLTANVEKEMSNIEKELSTNVEKEMSANVEKEISSNVEKETSMFRKESASSSTSSESSATLSRWQFKAINLMLRLTKPNLTYLT